MTHWSSNCRALKYSLLGEVTESLSVIFNSTPPPPSSSVFYFIVCVLTRSSRSLAFYLFFNLMFWFILRGTCRCLSHLSVMNINEQTGQKQINW